MTFICPCIGTTDFETVPLIQLSDSKALIQLFTSNDIISLEYEDTVTLRFTPSLSNLIQLVEDGGEFIRDTATVNIIDSDRKYILRAHTENGFQNKGNYTV